MRNVLLLSFCLVCIFTSSAEALTWPTSHPPDAVHAQLRKGFGSENDNAWGAPSVDKYDAYFWWSDGYLWQEIIPASKSPFICGGYLKQEGVDYYYFLRTSIGGSSFCADLSENKIFQIDLSSSDGPYDYLDTLIIHDGYSSAYDATIFVPKSELSQTKPPGQYNTYNLNMSIIGSGRITGNKYNCAANSTCSYAVEKESYVGINAIPDEGYSFLSWSGTCSGANQYCFFKMDSDKEARANFKAIPKSENPWIAPEDLTPYEPSGIQKELYLSKVGLGIVRSQMDWIYCGTRCSASFNKNQRITLTATPAPGWIFKKWKGACSNAKPVCNVKLNQRKKVKAVFIENPLNNLPGCGDVCSCARDLSPILGPGIIPIGCK